LETNVSSSTSTHN